MEEQQKQAYLDKVNDRIKEFGARLDELKARGERVNAETKIKINQQIEKLSRKKGDLEGKLSEIKASGKDAWSNLKIGLDAALNDLKTGIDKAISQFKK